MYQRGILDCEAEHAVRALEQHNELLHKISETPIYQRMVTSGNAVRDDIRVSSVATNMIKLGIEMSLPSFTHTHTLLAGASYWKESALDSATPPAIRDAIEHPRVRCPVAKFITSERIFHSLYWHVHSRVPPD